LANLEDAIPDKRQHVDFERQKNIGCQRLLRLIGCRYWIRDREAIADV